MTAVVWVLGTLTVIAVGGGLIHLAIRTVGAFRHEGKRVHS